MRPRVLRVDPRDIDPGLIQEAAEVLLNKGLVAFPTETVYGLGANALDPEAAARIFEAKKRPLDDPLIVHISRKEDLYELVRNVPSGAQDLMDKFWPGPLTLVLEKTDKVPDLVTTGLDTVAVRMPSNNIAREFIAKTGVPVAAPSANLFGRPSPTTAQHVVDDLGGLVDIVIDGGRTEVGVESTVVEFIGSEAVVLRPGVITVEDLESVISDVKVCSEDDLIENSPGKYPQHYSPAAEVIVVKDGPHQVEEVLSLASGKKGSGKKIGILSTEEHAELYKEYHHRVLGPAGDPRICASELFHALREFDTEGVDIIVAEAIPEQGIGHAVMNRLKKASG